MSVLKTDYADAFHFARIAHMAVGQKRKYTGEPYHLHCVAVAEMVRAYAPEADAAMIRAALLHDVIEDTHVSYEDLVDDFGEEVAALVLWLSDVYTPESSGLNRARRKAMEARRYAGAPARAKTIKLADLIDNTGSIVAHDPGFARVYLKEKADLLPALEGGNARLLERAHSVLEAAERELLA